MKLLILGHGRHGKDTVADMLKEEFGLTHLSSSEASATVFVFDELKDKYGYASVDECFEDRANHRSEWYDLICEYNAGDQARLAREIVERADIYVGMRSQGELDACIEADLFDFIIGIWDPRKPLEPEDSMSIDVGNYSQVLIINDKGLDELREKVINVFCMIKLFNRETFKKLIV